MLEEDYNEKAQHPNYAVECLDLSKCLFVDVAQIFAKKVKLYTDKFDESSYEHIGKTWLNLYLCEFNNK